MAKSRTASAPRPRRPPSTRGGDRCHAKRTGGPAAGPRDKAPDPNSPFAKLAALKAELEPKQGRPLRRGGPAVALGRRGAPAPRQVALACAGVRTRGAAAELVEAGRVRVNGARVNAAGQVVRRGDVLTLALDRTVRVIRVADFCERRGRRAERPRPLRAASTSVDAASLAAAGAQSRGTNSAAGGYADRLRSVSSEI